MTDKLSDKKFLIGNYTYIGQLFRAADETSLLFPTIEPTVLVNNPLVWFTSTADDENKEDIDEGGLNNILEYMRPTCLNSMQPYNVDEESAQGLHKILKGRFSEINPDMEIVLCDVAGNAIAGEASDIRGYELLPAGVPCYLHDADPVQVTVKADKSTGLYAMKIPTEPQWAMYLVTKTEFPLPKLLAKMEQLSTEMQEHYKFFFGR